MGSSPRLQLLIGTRRLARAALRGSAMCVAAVPLWMPASPHRGWLTCASVPTPLEQWPLCAGRRRGVSWSARQQEQELSLRPRTGLPRALHTLPHTQCSLSLAPGHTGRPARRPDSAVRRRAATPCSPSAQHKSCSELALLDPIWDEGQSSAATTCQTPAPGCTPTRISQSDMYHALQSPLIHSLER